jgi:hypothetical protein
MNVASALVSGHAAVPELAGEAVAKAMDKAGLAHAASVILLLSRDFARHPETALRAAARAAGCLRIAGAAFPGLLTEDGWSLDRPAAAALVFEADETDAGVPELCFTDSRTLPYAWRSDKPRAGLIGSEAAWQMCRRQDNDQMTFLPPASRCRSVLSTGLRRIVAPLPLESVDGFEIQRFNSQPAADALRRLLPPEWREQPPWHQIAALRHDDSPPVAILSANSDGSLSMADRFQHGEKVAWAIRQPMGSEDDMRRMVNAAVDGQNRPDFALMFSCIGRGPLFYGEEDRDLGIFRDCFPGVPLLGAYGNGQIVPGERENVLFNNSVLTLLFENSHVQPLP